MTSARHGLKACSTGVLVKGANVGQTKDLRRLADQLYARACADLVGCGAGLPGYRKPITFDKYAAWYATHITATKRGAEREHEIHRTLGAHFGPRALSAIDRDAVAEWMTARMQGGVSASTVNREVDLLKSILKRAVPTYLAASPLAGMKRLPVVRPKRRLMTEAEEDRLLAVMDPVERAFLLCGVDALVRLTDILDLRREDFTEGRWLYVADPKHPQQSTPLKVPVSRRLATALAALPEDTSGFLFPRYRVAKTARDRRGAVRQMLEAACARAGLPWGRRQSGITFHWATRRTGATRLIRDRRVDLKTVQQIGGWKRPEVMLDIYAETNDEALLAAVRPPELVTPPKAVAS
jgi:integrase